MSKNKETPVKLKNKQISLDDFFDIIDKEESSFDDTSIDILNTENTENFETVETIKNNENIESEIKVNESKDKISNNLNPSINFDNSELNTQLLNSINTQLVCITELLNEINFTLKAELTNNIKKEIKEIKDILNNKNNKDNKDN
ncbi:hypothetical protein BCR32DRAFT_248797 [Anaeromyces robustus]|uniref:Uncharacterized protein n=1 Tax=Anaeromyces robustus TaxID=1754192 RepID=A0A1Y1WSV1_9FUNG|nr:hypothetical protein BCR32DRAFT_248797 [Anaeromyces robustus]|eukprot:ORX76378.1 hypothetical protein BCR32DRAFT_248797 [Anaeromyces robustus]